MSLCINCMQQECKPEMETYFCKVDSGVTWSNIDIRSSTNISLHGSGWTVEQSETLMEIEKAAASVNCNLICHVFSLEDTVVYIKRKNLSGILYIEK